MLTQERHFRRMHPAVEVYFKNGKVKRWLTGKNVYYTNFNKRNFQRLSCFHCKYACDSRCGDITMGDFWGFKRANLNMSYKGGISCCLLNTPKSIKIFESLNLDVEKVDPVFVIQGNLHLRKPSPKGRNWDTVLNAVKKKGFDSQTIWFKYYNDIMKSYLKKFLQKLI